MSNTNAEKVTKLVGQLSDENAAAALSILMPDEAAGAVEAAYQAAYDDGPNELTAALSNVGVLLANAYNL